MFMCVDVCRSVYESDSLPSSETGDGGVVGFLFFFSGLVLLSLPVSSLNSYPVVSCLSDSDFQCFSSSWYSCSSSGPYV